MRNRSMKEKNRRTRLSLQNKDLARNQLNIAIDKVKKDKTDTTKEEDPLKFFIQKQRKKEKEEEEKRYLQKIGEEDGHLKSLEYKEEIEKGQGPLNF